MNLVIDTNVFVESINEDTPFHSLFLSIINQKHNVNISNEILSEYFEIFGRLYDNTLINILSEFFEFSENIILINPHYRFNLITVDPDDNKFVDTAICSNTDFLITSDNHFNILKKIQFPKINIISPQDFIDKHL